MRKPGGGAETGILASSFFSGEALLIGLAYGIAQLVQLVGKHWISEIHSPFKGFILTAPTPQAVSNLQPV